MFDFKSQALKSGAALVISAAILAQPAIAEEDTFIAHKTPSVFEID